VKKVKLTLAVRQRELAAAVVSVAAAVAVRLRAAVVNQLLVALDCWSLVWSVVVTLVRVDLDWRTVKR
jgi:hypothetical protein